MIMGLCLTLITWLILIPDPGLQNICAACLQICLMTMNLPDGIWAAPSLPSSLEGAVGLVLAAKPYPASPGQPLPLLAPCPSAPS